MGHKYSFEMYRFKASGKYYDVVTFASNSEFMYQVFEEVKRAKKANLISQEFIYLLTGKLANGEDHTNGYPGLIL